MPGARERTSCRQSGVVSSTTWWPRSPSVCPTSWSCATSWMLFESTLRWLSALLGNDFPPAGGMIAALLGLPLIEHADREVLQLSDDAPEIGGVVEPGLVAAGLLLGQHLRHRLAVDLTGP